MFFGVTIMICEDDNQIDRGVGYEQVDIGGF